MKITIRKGFGFGLTSGIITTLGMIVGLHAGTHSKMVVLGGIVIIAMADALSDALGVHVSEEAENEHSTKEIWESTLATFGSKLIIALTFVIPVLLFALNTAIIISVIWGLFLIVIFSFYMAIKQGKRPFSVVMEHLFIAALVIVVTHYIGDWINKIFV